MSTERSGSMVKEMLKYLCSNNGWSYGVLWSFNQQNFLLLTLQDAYYEEQIGVLIDDMLLQVNMLGEGVIGRAAFTKKHQYLFSDTHHEKANAIGSGEECELYQEDSEIFSQFSSGIKTIAVIPVEPFGVVQFGSFQKLPETIEFVEQTKLCFSGMENGGFIEVQEKSSSSLSAASGLFASLISGEDAWFQDTGCLHGAGEEELMEAIVSPTNLIHPVPSSSYGQSMDLLDAQFSFDGCGSNINPQQSLPQSSSIIDYATDRAPFCSTLSCGDSSMTSSMQSFPQIRPSNSDDMLSMISDGCGIDATKIAQDSTTDMFYSDNMVDRLDPTHWLYSSESKHEGLTSLNPCQYLFQEIDTVNAFTRSCPVNEFSEVPSVKPDVSSEMVADTLNNFLSQEVGLSSLLPNFRAHIEQAAENRPSDSVQSSITNVLSRVENKNCEDMSGMAELLDCFRVGPSYGKSGHLNDNLISAVSRGHLDIRANNSKGNSFPVNKLFSSLGINPFADEVTSSSCSVAKSSLNDQLSFSTKRRKIETSFPSSDQVKFSNFSRFDGNVSSVQPLYNPNRINYLGSKSDAILKSETDSLVGDSYGNAGKGLQPNGHEQPAKTLKKKAKPGTHPRPKDRQQIQDRLSELRKLIPNGEKMSIDRLLHRTIKHLLFLQSVTQHAERLKQVDEPKQLDRTVHQDPLNTRDCGVTWACEVGDETMVCPLIVEDLNTPGQMSIEIQCEEQDSFLEIVDIVRGFGLIILKGVMEAREAKTCACFTVAVEGNRHVTRHDIFSSLVQLLQLTGSRGANPTEFDDIVNGGTGRFDTCQQSARALPVSMAETIQRSSL